MQTGIATKLVDRLKLNSKKYIQLTQKKLGKEKQKNKRHMEQKKKKQWNSRPKSKHIDDYVHCKWTKLLLKGRDCQNVF